MVDQLFLFTVHLRLETAKPAIKVVFAERMRNLVIVFQSIFEVHLCRCILGLVVLDIAYSCFTTSRSQTTANLCKLCSGSRKEGLSLSIVASIKQDASFDSEKIGKHKILISFLGDDDSIVEISLDGGVLHFFDDNQDGDIVDDEDIDCFFLLSCLLELHCLDLLTLLDVFKNLCICPLGITNLVLFIFFKTVELHFENILV